MTRFADCSFVLWVGKRRMIKRELFDEYAVDGIISMPNKTVVYMGTIKE